MTDPAAPPEPMTHAPGDVGTPRGSLFRKYLIVLLFLVGGVLVASSLVELYFSYRETQVGVVRVEREKAAAAAIRIEQFVKEIERQVRATVQPGSTEALGTGPSREGALLTEQRELDFLRLLRNAQAIGELRLVDASGREQLRVSRLALDAVGSGEDLSREEWFREARAGQTYFSPVWFRNDSEPVMTIAVPAGDPVTEVTSAEVNLRATWDLVSRLQVGAAGQAYVVDSAGHLIAHPDISLVLQKRDLARLPQVQAARVLGAHRDPGATVTTAEALQGGKRVLAVHATIVPLGWLVIIERPLAEAFAPLRDSIVRSVMILAAGLVLAVLASVILARRMVAPIRVLQLGAARMGGGDLGHRIDVRTGDELEALGAEINHAAARLAESHETLEQRVRARTQELAHANAELTESLEQQTAVSEILRAITSAPADLQAMLDGVAERIARLGDADDCAILRRDGATLRTIAGFGAHRLAPGFEIPVDRGSVTGRAVLEGTTLHVPDFAQESTDDYPGGTAIQPHLAARTLLATPLLREGEPLGAILTRRLDVRPFTDRQVSLIRTFADQAVIAIDNARLFAELAERNAALTESLDRQTAITDVLRATTGSPEDLQPVFQSIAGHATRLCGGLIGSVWQYDGELIHFVANHGLDEDGLARLRGYYPRPARNADSFIARSILERSVVHVPDVPSDPNTPALSKLSARNLGYRSILVVPILRDDRPLGAISVSRGELPFTDKHIELVKTFADQAVVAIESVRLLQEVRARTRELTRSVEELQALGAVSQAVSSSLDLDSVLDSIVSHAVQLTGADAGTIYEYDEAAARFDLRVTHGMTHDHIEALRAAAPRLGEGAVGRAVAALEPVEIPDVTAPGAYDTRLQDVTVGAGFRALLAVPLTRESRIIGGLVVRRRQPGRFAPEQVNLLRTFAAQSTLAIQNARLFREIEEKSRELENLSRNQEQLSRLSAAMQEPLSLVEQLTRVLDAARQVVRLDRLYIWTFSPDGDALAIIAQAGFAEADWTALEGVTIPVHAAGAIAAACEQGAPLLFSAQHPLPAALRLGPPYASLAGLRVSSFLVVPMIARGRTVGALAADNRTSRAPIPPATVELLQTFAAQAAVAVENGRLFQAIQDQGRELEIASRHKSQFLANMSHELRTPMNAIIGVSEMLLEDAQDLGRAEEIEPLERVLRAGRHLLALINDILDLSKIEAGKMDLHLEAFSVAALVADVAATVGPLVEKNGNRLTVECAADLGAIRADPTRVRQALLNLASNAAKFTEHGAMAITATRSREADGHWVRIVVADTGIGMTAEQTTRLFQDFMQADASTTRRYGGTGLGLAISRRFCRMMGGDITVRSAPGAGSTFTIRLPVDTVLAGPESDTADAPAAPAAAATATPAAETSSGPLVLVVDDDPTVREVLSRFLTREGFSVVTAGGGLEALARARALHPAAITLDVLMADVDGWTVLTALKNDPTLSDIPVVLLTIVDERSRGYTLGAAEYLVKPVDRDRLVAVLHRLCGRRAGRLLIVEDDSAARALIRQALEREGWTVDEADNGRAGLERVAVSPPDAIVLDLMMPEMDGFEFLEALRGQRSQRDIPVVVVTALDLTEDDRRRLDGGVRRVLQKGAYGRDELLREVAGLLTASVRGAGAPAPRR
jgi:signal transduction histidine kinase/CheY-like chemotaxis protein/putative methionine-R-sulfoxide reductase with GAF domain